MSALSEFVLGLYRYGGAIVESPGYGVYEVLLTDAWADEWGFPAYQRLTFDAMDQPSEGVEYVTQGHPWVERLVERMRRAPAPSRGYINAVRLDKPGLADAAQQAYSFPNARLVEPPGATLARALCHLVGLSFKVTLNTDEKHEHLATVWMDAQSGWCVDPTPLLNQASLDAKPAFAYLSEAAPRWITAEGPLAPKALAALVQRAARGALDQMADVVSGVQRRIARYLELDRARLDQYYADLQHDLDRRMQRVEEERRPALEDKLAATRSEREMKLADAEARYRLRIDLELITAQVITQPKLILPMDIENRTASVRRSIVWDPLLHQFEPLACDVCGQPGFKLHLCAEGHLVHDGCLLEAQCSDCKRVHCRLCADKMGACVVCGRAICLKSLNRCRTCGRGTCHEHVGLCHAAEGAPATLSSPARPTETPERAPTQSPKREAGQGSSDDRAAGPPPPARSAPPAPPAKPRSTVKPRQKTPPKAPPARVAVQVEWNTAEVIAFVLTGRKRGPATRTWSLTPNGIQIGCACEKQALCPANDRLMRPADASEIEAQMRGAIESLCKEYHVPAHRVSYLRVTPEGAVDEPGLILNALWKDKDRLALAQTGWQAVYDRQHNQFQTQWPGAWRRPQPPKLSDAERTEADRVVAVAHGLLVIEGVLKGEDLHAQLQALLRPGGWCTLSNLKALLDADRRFKVLAGGLVASAQVRNVQATMQRKARYALPPLALSLDALLAASESEKTLSAEQGRLERELRRLIPDVSVGPMQHMARNAESPAMLTDRLVQSRPWLADDPSVLRFVETLWRRTPRWELRGRTPAEVSTGEHTT